MKKELKEVLRLESKYAKIGKDIEALLAYGESLEDRIRSAINKAGLHKGAKLLVTQGFVDYCDEKGYSIPVLGEILEVYYLYPNGLHFVEDEYGYDVLTLPPIFRCEVISHSDIPLSLMVEMRQAWLDKE